jgi:hypothetical protein
MEIKEFAFRNKLEEPMSIQEAIDQDILYHVIAAAKHASIGRRIREERRGFIEWILRTLRRLSPKRWF